MVIRTEIKGCCVKKELVRIWKLERKSEGEEGVKEFLVWFGEVLLLLEILKLKGRISLRKDKRINLLNFYSGVIVIYVLYLWKFK